MSSGTVSARETVLGRVRRALGAAAGDADRRAAVEARLSGHPRTLIPARVTGKSPADLVDLFVQMAHATAATVHRLPSREAVPDAVADFLIQHNLPAAVRAAPELAGLSWDRRPSLTVASGRAQADDLASVTGAHAAVAETGTLMLTSGSDRPTTLNFLPDTHIVVLEADQVVGSYEDGWDRLRALGALPRTVNFITGPSRTGDIEQTIQLGAHGPRRLHILLVDPSGN